MVGNRWIPFKKAGSIQKGFRCHNAVMYSGTKGKFSWWWLTYFTIYLWVTSTVTWWPISSWLIAVPGLMLSMRVIFIFSSLYALIPDCFYSNFKSVTSGKILWLKFASISCKIIQQVNATEHSWWYVNIGPCRGLVPTSNTSLPKQMFNQIYGAMWRK